MLLPRYLEVQISFGYYSQGGLFGQAEVRTSAAFSKSQAHALIPSPFSESRLLNQGRK